MRGVKFWVVAIMMSIAFIIAAENRNAEDENRVALVFDVVDGKTGNAPEHLRVKLFSLPDTVAVGMGFSYNPRTGKGEMTSDNLRCGGEYILYVEKIIDTVVPSKTGLLKTIYDYDVDFSRGQVMHVSIPENYESEDAVKEHYVPEELREVMSKSTGGSVILTKEQDELLAKSYRNVYSYNVGTVKITK